MSHSAPQERIGKLLGSGQQVAAVDDTRRMRQSTKELVNKSRARSFISFGQYGKWLFSGSFMTFVVSIVLLPSLPRGRSCGDGEDCGLY